MCSRKLCKGKELKDLLESMAVILVLVFCSAAAAMPQPVLAEEASAGHEALTMMTNQGNDYEEFLEALHEEYPEINIELISYNGKNTTEYNEVLMEAGDLPDIYVGTYASQKELQPERLIDLSGENFTSKFDTSLINNVSIDGSVYLLPVNVSFLGIYYNKTLFEKFGWKVPQSLEEIETLIPEMKAAGVTLSECDTKLTGVMFTWLFNLAAPDFMTSLSGVQWQQEFLKGEASATGHLESSMEYIQRWIDDGILNIGETPKDSDAILDRFKEGNTAFLFTNSSVGFTQNEDGTGDEYGLLPYLSEDGSSNTIITNVTRHVGLSKELEKNPRKLEDALKVMSFLATEKGQSSIRLKDNEVSALKTRTIAEDSPIYEASRLLEEGRAMELVYSGWENYAVGVGEDMYELIGGTITGEELLEDMDALQANIQEEGGLPALAEVEEDLDKSQTAQLVGAAYAEATGADCALISVGDYHGTGMENSGGVNARIYAAVPLTENVVSTFNPLGWNNKICTMKLTGKTIKEWAEEGYFVDGDPTPFPYILVTKNSEELDDDTEYTVACVTESEDRAAEGNLTETEVIGLEALTAYISELGTINGETIFWK